MKHESIIIVKLPGFLCSSYSILVLMQSFLDSFMPALNIQRGGEARYTYAYDTCCA